MSEPLSLKKPLVALDYVTKKGFLEEVTFRSDWEPTTYTKVKAKNIPKGLARQWPYHGFKLDLVRRARSPVSWEH